MFTQDLKLVGVMFDGNEQEVPSIYSYIPPETGGRSISVDVSAIMVALEHIYAAKWLREEILAAAEEAEAVAK